MYLGGSANPALLKLYTHSVLAYALSVGAIYITETFFIITGCLTAYLIFKHRPQPTTETTTPKPLGWLLLPLNRLPSDRAALLNSIQLRALGWPQMGRRRTPMGLRCVGQQPTAPVSCGKLASHSNTNHKLSEPLRALHHWRLVPVGGYAIRHAWHPISASVGVGREQDT